VAPFHTWRGMPLATESRQRHSAPGVERRHPRRRRSNRLERAQGGLTRSPPSVPAERPVERAGVPPAAHGGRDNPRPTLPSVRPACLGSRGAYRRCGHRSGSDICSWIANKSSGGGRVPGSVADLTPPKPARPAADAASGWRKPSRFRREPPSFLPRQRVSVRSREVSPRASHRGARAAKFPAGPTIVVSRAEKSGPGAERLSPGAE